MSPWGWECRQKFVKQVPQKQTERTHPIVHEIVTPGPDHYEQPQICGGKGFSKIKRAPAYSFGHLTKATFNKPATTARAPMLDLRGTSVKGNYRIPASIVTPRNIPPGNKLAVPGPGAYENSTSIQYKRAPAYSMRIAGRQTYQPPDQWTPPPNMYCPPIPKKNAPEFSFGYPVRELSSVPLPGPGENDPNYKYVKRNKPSYSFGAPFRPAQPKKTPPPNTYCEKKFMVGKRTSPAPSFGIRHSPYLGVKDIYVKPPHLEVRINGDP